MRPVVEKGKGGEGDIVFVLVVVVVRGEDDTYVLGAICKYPMALTLFNLFFNAAKAEDCGRSMRSPYRHLYRCGYLSGSNS